MLCCFVCLSSHVDVSVMHLARLLVLAVIIGQKNQAGTPMAQLVEQWGMLSR